MASPLPSTSSVPDAQQRFWDTAEMNLAVYSHVKRDRDARSLAATSLSLRCWQHPRIPKHMSLPGDFPKFSRDPEINRQAWSAFLTLCSTIGSLEVDLWDFMNALPSASTPPHFSRLSMLKASIYGAEHLLGQFLTPKLTSLELIVDLITEADAIKTLTSIVDHAAPTMGSLTCLILNGVHTPRDGEWIEPDSSHIPWGWKLFHHLPNPQYLTYFGARNCSVPVAVLHAIRDLKFLTTLQLDARVPPHGERYWGAKLQDTLKRMESQKTLEALWLRFDQQSPVDFDVLKEFPNLNDLNIGTDCWETGSRKNVRKLGELKGLQKVALFMMDSPWGKPIDSALFRHLIAHWPNIRAITLLEYELDIVPFLRIEDLGTLGLLTPHLRWLKVIINPDMQNAALPASTLPDGMTLDMGPVSVDANNAPAVTHALKALGLQQGKLRTEGRGAGWDDIRPHFGTPDKHPLESSVVIM